MKWLFRPEKFLGRSRNRPQDPEVAKVDENVVPTVHEVFQKDDELQGGSHEIHCSETTEVVQPEVDDIVTVINRTLKF